MQRDRIPFERPVSIRDAGRGNTVRHVKSVNGASEVLDRLAACAAWAGLSGNRCGDRGDADRQGVGCGRAAAFEAFAKHAEVLVAG